MSKPRPNPHPSELVGRVAAACAAVAIADVESKVTKLEAENKQLRKVAWNSARRLGLVFHHLDDTTHEAERDSLDLVIRDLRDASGR